MNGQGRAGRWLQLLLVIAVLLPLLILLVLPLGPFLAGLLWLWMLVMVLVWMAWMLLSGWLASSGAMPARPRMLFPDEQPETIRELMDVRIATEEGGVLVFRGTLREPAESAFEKLKHAFPEGIVPLLQADDQLGTAILLMPRPIEEARLERPVRPWLHWLLFGLTAVTTTWAGAAHQGVNLWQEPEQFSIGLPYAIGLLMILGVHELGHYFTARGHGMHVTPPYFIPVPFALGTFGAFIQMKSPPETRRVLFDVAVAGPLAGLVVAVPALVIGLQTSEIIAEEPAAPWSIFHGTAVNSSLLFALLVKLALPEAFQYGCVLQLGPLAFAGWLGLLVTALNLLPIGQLDGGHTARALFGRHVGEMIGNIAMWSLLLLAIFVWPALLLFAIIVFFLAGRGTPPLNDLTPLNPGRKWVGAAVFLILGLILVPLPQAFWGETGIHCPYL